LLLLASGIGGALWVARRIELQIAHALERAAQAEQRASHHQRQQVLGRLTGAVAHDFNNLLGVVSNNMHLIQRHPAAAELQMPLAATQRAVDSGSQLTQLLLCFARRQPKGAQVLALSQHLPEVQELLRCVLGRRIEVSLQVDAATQALLMDGAELELALITLALDASDAMPRGGKLRLGAHNASANETAGLAGHPGRAYVVVSVAHDGVGLDSGPGLTQASAMCIQAGGAARVDSTDVGTAVSLLLPAASGDDGVARRSADDR
jgi:signal transduction histidine kinase